MLYSCEASDTNQEEQFELVKKDCQGKEDCKIEASREYFGNSECPGSDNSKMSLLLIYTCDAGGTDRTILFKPICDDGNVYF